MKKFFLLVVFVLTVLSIGIKKVSAEEIFNNEIEMFSLPSNNIIQPYAIRHNFDFTVPRFAAREVIRHPLDDDGITPIRAKYIRVRLEPGSGGGDTVDFRAIASDGYAVRIITEKNSLPFSGNVNIIIDFKAKNAPCRDDATYCIDCPSVYDLETTISTNDYCVYDPSLYYGIQVYNGSWFGGTPRVYGGFSFEN